MSLADKVALVTGASRGIGAAIVQELAAKGVLVALVGRDVQALRSTLESIGGESSGLALPCDLISEEIGDLVSPVLTRFGRLDILIHSAGLIIPSPVRNTHSADLRSQFGVNIWAPYLVTQSFLPYLIETHGDVVFINSLITRTFGEGRAAYAATKHALKSFADSLREEVKTADVRVTTVFPGSTATPMQAKICTQVGKVYRPERLIQPRDIARTVVSTVALPRTTEITDIYMRPRSPASYVLASAICALSGIAFSL